MRALIFVVAVSAISLLPQTAPQEKEAKSFLDLGMSTLQRGQKEEACLLFEKARNAAAKIKDAFSRNELAAKINFQATLADPLIQKRRKAEESAARVLLRAGRVYLKKGWILTASPFITEAALLAPKLAAADMKRLSAAIPSKRASSRDQVFTVFGRMENAYGQNEWVKDKEGLKAPVDKIDSTSMLLSNSVVLPGTKIHFEVLARESDCSIGLGIGYKKDGSFHYVELSRSDGSTLVRCSAFLKDWQSLESVQYSIKKEDWEKWIPFDVEIRENELTWKIGTSKTYVTRCKKPDLIGKLGFYVFYEESNEKDFIFRNFRMEIL